LALLCDDDVDLPALHRLHGICSLCFDTRVFDVGIRPRKDQGTFAPTVGIEPTHLVRGLPLGATYAGDDPCSAVGVAARPLDDQPVSYRCPHGSARTPRSPPS